jgi:hypothetical protein
MNDFWSVIATLAATLSAIAAMVALFYSAKAAQATAKAADVNALFLVIQLISDAERDLYAKELRDVALKNYLNLLEGLASAVNGKIFADVTLRISKDRLKNDITFIDKHWETVIQSAKTSTETFLEIRKFCRKNNLETKHFSD